MRELDIVGIIKQNFEDRIEFLEEEKLPTIYEILRSPKYNGLLRRYQRSNTICKGFTVAKICLVYKGIRVTIEFTLPFAFYNEFVNGICNREGRVIVPVIDLNEISIQEPKFANEINREWFYKKVDDIKYGTTTSRIREFNITSLICHGHRKSHSGRGIRPRIVSYVECLLDAIDFAKKQGE